MMTNLTERCPPPQEMKNSKSPSAGSRRVADRRAMRSNTPQNSMLLANSKLKERKGSGRNKREKIKRLKEKRNPAEAIILTWRN